MSNRVRGIGGKGLWVLLILVFLFISPIKSHGYVITPQSISHGIINSIVAVPINIDTVNDLEAWQICIDFDPTILTLVDLDLSASILSYFYHIEYNLGVADPPVATKERITVAGILRYDENPSISPAGSGALFYVNFLVNGPDPGATDIEVSVMQEAGAPLIEAGPPGVFYAETVLYQVTSQSSRSVTKGENFYLPVNINTDQDLQGWVMDIVYDPDVMEFKRIGSAGTLTQNYDYLEYYEVTPGLVHVAGIINNVPAGTSGLFLQIYFRANNLGNTYFRLEYPNDKGNQFGPVTPFQGLVKVKTQTVPGISGFFGATSSYSLTYPANLRFGASPFMHTITFFPQIPSFGLQSFLYQPNRWSMFSFRPFNYGFGSTFNYFNNYGPFSSYYYSFPWNNYINFGQSSN